MKTDRSGRTFEEYRQLYWDGQKRIDELEAVSELSEVTHRAMKAEYDCKRLRATIKRVEAVGFEVHDSWGASEEFKDGWRECRAQVEEALGEAK